MPVGVVGGPAQGLAHPVLDAVVHVVDVVDVEDDVCVGDVEVEGWFWG